MDEITKSEFLKNFNSEFAGDDQVGYNYKGIFIEEDRIKEITKGMLNNISDLEKLIRTPDESGDDFTELNNLIMAHIFGDGDEFQGSYEEEAGSGNYSWYLDFGDIEIDRKRNGFSYTGVRFYKS